MAHADAVASVICPDSMAAGRVDCSGPGTSIKQSPPGAPVGRPTRGATWGRYSDEFQPDSRFESRSTWIELGAGWPNLGSIPAMSGRQFDSTREDPAIQNSNTSKFRGGAWPCHMPGSVVSPM